MSNENVHSAFKGILDSISGESNLPRKVKIGDDSAYAEYIYLAQSCERLIDELNKVAANLPIDVKIAMGSIYFSLAVQHLKKVNKSTIHEPD